MGLIMKTTTLLLRLIFSLSLCFSMNTAYADTPQMGRCLCTPTGAGSLKKSQCTTSANVATAAENPAFWPETSPVYNSNHKNEGFPWLYFLQNFSRKGDQCPLYKEELEKRIYFFDSPIRIGDDLFFNENPKHSGMSFCITSAPYHSYTTTFIIPEKCSFNTATLQFWATGVWNDDFVYLNGIRLAEICHTGNIAMQGDIPIQGIDTCCTNGTIDISTILKVGVNTLKINLSKYPWDDDGTPYDDIEVYDMHIIIDSAK